MTTNAGVVVRQRQKKLFIDGGNSNQYGHYENQLGGSSKLEIYLW